MSKEDKKSSILAEIASISMGYAFRKSVPQADRSGTFLLELQESPESYLLRKEDFQPIQDGSVPDSQALQQDDLILRGKGKRHYTVLFRLPDFKAVVSQQFVVIRVNDAQVLPEYLLWFLNQRSAQKYLEKISAGTMVPQVTIRELGYLPVILPSVAEQKALSEIFLLRELEKAISQKLSQRRELLINEKLLKIVEA